MKKLILISGIILALSVAIIDIYTTKSENSVYLSNLTKGNLTALSNDEVTTITVKDNVDDPKGCSTQKTVTVKVQLADGAFTTEIQIITVRGSENNCERKENKTCDSFACYTN